MNINFKQIFLFFLIIIFFINNFIFINQARSQELIKEGIETVQKEPEKIRVIISVSGPVKFDSYWLDDPTRLAVEFKSKNVVSNIDKNIAMASGPIKNINSTYFKKGKTKALKRLTFEMVQKLPYEILEKENSVILEVEVPKKINAAPLNKEILITSKDKERIAKRLKAMEVELNKTMGGGQALLLGKQAEAIQGDLPSDKIKEPPKPAETKKETSKKLPAAATAPSQANTDWIWLSMLIAISGGGLFAWYKYWAGFKLNKLKLKETYKRLDQERQLRREIEKISKNKENQYKQLEASSQSLRAELKKKDELLADQGNSYKATLKKELAKKDKAYQELRDAFRALKGEGAQKFEGAGEKREFGRLPLTKNFDNSVILRVKPQGLAQDIKCFAKNISSGGLCFKASQKLDENTPLNLRLFFYGALVPAMKIQARIGWRKKLVSEYEYGVCFESLEDKDKRNLERYTQGKLQEVSININQ